jgi:hypothetical protein
MTETTPFPCPCCGDPITRTVCAECGRPLAEDSDCGGVFCLPQSSPDCWTEGRERIAVCPFIEASLDHTKRSSGQRNRVPDVPVRNRSVVLSRVGRSAVRELEPEDERHSVSLHSSAGTERQADCISGPGRVRTLLDLDTLE